jgi:hypothetical protein
VVDEAEMADTWRVFWQRWLAARLQPALVEKDPLGKSSSDCIESNALSSEVNHCENGDTVKVAVAGEGEAVRNGVAAGAANSGNGALISTDAATNDAADSSLQSQDALPVPPAPLAAQMLDLGMGFPREWCEFALAKVGDDFEQAINYCLEHTEYAKLS